MTVVYDTPIHYRMTVVWDEVCIYQRRVFQVFHLQRNYIWRS